MYSKSIIYLFINLLKKKYCNIMTIFVLLHYFYKINAALVSNLFQKCQTNNNSTNPKLFEW